ncbi:hypothetical protein HG530_006397 [Fusarium avenaceum]|nr:hypothetical protein HG530_006397 [Fusarium avenaceum]
MGLRKTVNLARIAVRAAGQLSRLAAVRVALKEIAVLACILAGVGDSTCVAIDTAIHSSDVLDDNVSGSAVILTVTARSDQLAVILNVKVGDLNSAAAVELDYLVGGVESTAATDDRSSRLLFQSNSVLADVLEPDILESARAFTVDTLSLAGADDDVAESGAVFEDEHSIGFASLFLVLAHSGWKVLGKFIKIKVERLTGSVVVGHTTVEFTRHRDSGGNSSSTARCRDDSLNAT